MKKQYVRAKIIKSREDGILVLTILGLENHPKAYKETYEQLIEEINHKMMRIVSNGEHPPIVRVQHSLEIH